MAHIIRRPGWSIREGLMTSESAFLNRRHFLSQLGLAGAGLCAASSVGCSQSDSSLVDQPSAGSDGISASSSSGANAQGYPAPRNPGFNPGWRLTDEKVAAKYNNFYEFSTDKERVQKLVGKFITSPWAIELSGLIDKPMTLEIQELIDMMGIEERVYRFRCVEAWAMIVAWTGFPLSRLIEKVSPKAEAKFIRFQTFLRPDQAPNFRDQTYPWPYTEGLRLDEASNPLTLVATGIYGKPLPKQQGAPVRLIVPWKYGYKSIKSIVKIEFVSKQPATLWETLAPHEYPFESNVNPAIPHPRWSQETERMIDTGDRVRTQMYNGYGDYVAKLYAGK